MSSDAATAANATSTSLPRIDALSGGPVGGPDPDLEQPRMGLGSSLPATDARAKTEGTFPYAADLWAEGLLWAAVLRSPHPHARILSIDTSGAEEMPGVRAVVTHEDVPGESNYGRHVVDRPVFASDLVRHHGEPIAAVAADHPDTARLAAAAIAVRYEVLEPVTDPEKAFEAEPLHPDGNLIRHIPLRYGDAEATGDVVVEGLYRIGRQDPAPIGAEAGLAVPRPDGGVEIYTSSTDPHTDRDLVAACFGLEPDRVKVVVTGVPGATGDREDPGFQIALGLLALRTGCPVKLAASREESFLGHTHRHPTLLRYRHHADAEGRLVKVEAQILLDAGAYADASSESLAAAVAFACGPYVVPHAFIEGWAVRTNNPPSGHVRGEGAMQVCAAYEGQMDKLAAKLGIDPAELRLRNTLSTGDILPTGQTVTCPAPVAELLQAVRDFPLPALPKDAPEDDWLLPGGPEGAGEPGAVRRGVGYGVGMVHMLGAEGTDEVSTATVRVHDGVATVICAAVETGQGFTTLARQIVQEVLGVEEVHVAAVDTDQPPPARPPTAATPGSPAGRWSARRRWSAPSSSSRWPTSSACPRSCSRSPTARSPRTTGCSPPPSWRPWTARNSGPPPSAAPTPRNRWTRRARATRSSASRSARCGRWWTSTSSSARSAWSRWRSPRTWAAS
ncbi:oxidoreductase [Streptomyces badius]